MTRRSHPHTHPPLGFAISVEKSEDAYHVHVIADVGVEFTVPWSMLEERGARPLRRGEKVILTINGAVLIERHGEELVFEPILMDWPLKQVILTNHGDYVDVSFYDYEVGRVVLPRIFAEQPAVPWSEMGRHIEVSNVKHFIILLVQSSPGGEGRMLYANLDYGPVKIRTAKDTIVVKTAYPMRLPLGVNRYQVLPLLTSWGPLIEEVQMELDVLSRRIEGVYEDTLVIMFGDKRLLLASQQNRRFDVALPRASTQPVEAAGPIYHVVVEDTGKPAVIGYSSWY